jgi:hypothetical protein
MAACLLQQQQSLQVLAFALAQDLFNGTHALADLDEALWLRKRNALATTQLLFRQEHVAFLVQDVPILYQATKKFDKEIGHSEKQQT